MLSIGGFFMPKRLVLMSVAIFIICIFLLQITFIKRTIDIILLISFPFVTALIIILLIYPFILKLETYRINRMTSFLLMMFGFFIVSIVIIKYIYHMILHDFMTIINNIQILLDELIVYSEIEAKMPTFIQETMQQVAEYFQKNKSVYTERTINYLNRMIQLLLLSPIIPFSLYYLIKDMDKLKSYFKKNLDKIRFKQMMISLVIIRKQFILFFKSQLILFTVVFSVYFISFTVMNMPHKLSLSLFASLMNIIPYIGPMIGGIPILLVAHTISFNYFIISLIVMSLTQIIEGLIIAPFIIGKTVKIHPMIVLMFVLGAGYFFNLIGMILAIPILTSTYAIIQAYHENELHEH